MEKTATTRKLTNKLGTELFNTNAVASWSFKHKANSFAIGWWLKEVGVQDPCWEISRSMVSAKKRLWVHVDSRHVKH